MRKEIREAYSGGVRLFTGLGEETEREIVELIAERKPRLLLKLEQFLVELRDNRIAEIDFTGFAASRLILLPGSFRYVISDEELLEYRTRLFKALEANTSVHTIRWVSFPMQASADEWLRLFSHNKTLRHIVFYSCAFDDEEAEALTQSRLVKEARVVVEFLDERLLSLDEQKRLLSRGIHVEGDELDDEEMTHRCHSAPPCA